MKDYYLILGIERNSSLAEIKAAYRKLSKKFHPDLNPDDIFFEERFKDIQNGYETLSVEKNRKAYDTKLNNSNFYRGNASGERAAENRFRQREQKLKAAEEQLGREMAIFLKEKEEHIKVSNKATRNKTFRKVAALISIYAILVTLVLAKKILDQPASVPIEETSHEQPYQVVILPEEPLNAELIISDSTATKEIPNKKVKNTVFDGTWLGRATQYNIGESWKVKITCDFENEVFEISYPGLGCGGDLVFLRQSKDKIEFRENLTYGKDICTTGGKVVIEKIDDKTIFSYYYPTDDHLDAQGEINRS